MAKAPDITTLLIANRGEIARRIIRTAHEMGIRTVAVYSEPDADAPYVVEADCAVPLAGASASETYLDQGQLLAAARATGANAIHPGYGFLSENAAFAEACAAAGYVWVGPPAEAIRQMGLKVVAKAIAREASVPTLPDATITGDDASDWEAAARSVGYPLLVKASAGGGGKGMRRVERARELKDALAGARREAQNSFGDATVFLERYLAAPRHIEVQVFADMRGHVIHLYERECSIQRRYQKVIEEAPSLAVTPELRERLVAASVALAQAIGYVGAGTVEYLVDGDQFYFLEVNTRLQVEHPVTEAITGLDLVRWQIQVARGEPLPLEQHEVVCQGHAIEARLYGEDPSAGFLPTFGRLVCFAPGPTPGVRYDAGVVSGSEISPYYDPMLAKVIVHAPSRAEAARRLARALNELRVHGVRTNRDFLVATLRHPDFLAGATTTDFIAQRPELLAAQPSPATQDAHLLATVAALAQRRRDERAVQSFAPSGWRNAPAQGQRVSFATTDGAVSAVVYRIDSRRRPLRLTLTRGQGDGASSLEADALAVAPESVRLVIDGVHHVCHVNVVGDVVYVNSAGGQTELRELPRFVEPEAAAVARGPVAELPGAVVAVAVASGDRVAAGQTLVVIEAMKMEHQITAHVNGVVERLLVGVGDKVNAHQLLVILREESAE